MNAEELMLFLETEQGVNIHHIIPSYCSMHIIYAIYNSVIKSVRVSEIITPVW